MPSPDNSITPEKVKLGSMLFWEPRISSDGVVSCVKCHSLGRKFGVFQPYWNLTKSQPIDEGRFAVTPG
jgi:cytochrome c peroxidase